MLVINGVVENNTTRKLDPDEFRGFVLSDEFAPLIFVNGADSKAAQLFTLIHELAHIWLGASGIFDLPHTLTTNDKIEKFCNKVPAEYLVPEIEFREHWVEAERRKRPFEYLARRFKVSPIVVARRALDLKYIDREYFFHFYDNYNIQLVHKKTKRKKGGGDFWRNQKFRVGDNFARSVISAAREGHLLYRKAYSLLGLKQKSFETYAKRLGL